MNTPTITAEAAQSASDGPKQNQTTKAITVNRAIPANNIVPPNALDQTKTTCNDSHVRQIAREYVLKFYGVLPINPAGASSDPSDGLKVVSAETSLRSQAERAGVSYQEFAAVAETECARYILSQAQMFMDQYYPGSIASDLHNAVASISLQRWNSATEQAECIGRHLGDSSVFQLMLSFASFLPVSLFRMLRVRMAAMPGFHDAPLALAELDRSTRFASLPVIFRLAENERDGSDEWENAELSLIILGYDWPNNYPGGTRGVDRAVRFGHSIATPATLWCPDKTHSPFGSDSSRNRPAKIKQLQSSIGGYWDPLLDKATYDMMHRDYRQLLCTLLAMPPDPAKWGQFNREDLLLLFIEGSEIGFAGGFMPHLVEGISFFPVGLLRRILEYIASEDYDCGNKDQQVANCQKLVQAAVELQLTRAVAKQACGKN